jgi:hypothetical protein
MRHSKTTIYLFEASGYPSEKGSEIYYLGRRDKEQQFTQGKRLAGRHLGALRLIYELVFLF